MQTSGKQVILCILCITLSCWWLVLTQGGRLYCLMQQPVQQLQVCGRMPCHAVLLTSCNAFDPVTKTIACACITALLRLCSNKCNCNVLTCAVDDVVTAALPWSTRQTVLSGVFMCTCTMLAYAIQFNEFSCFAGQGKSVTGACTLHAGTCIVSNVFQQQLREQILLEARQAAESAQQQRRASTKMASISQPSAGQQEPSNTKSGEEPTSEEACVQPHRVPQLHWFMLSYADVELDRVLASLSMLC